MADVKHKVHVKSIEYSVLDELAARQLWRNNSMFFHSLDEVFSHLHSVRMPPLADCVGRTLSEDQLKELERLTNEVLPKDVRLMLQKYDVCNLEFGELAFGAEGGPTYLEAMNYENDKFVSWWGNMSVRPSGLLCCAVGHSGVVLLDCKSSKVLVLDGHIGEVKAISDNLEAFILTAANCLWNSNGERERLLEQETTFRQQIEAGYQFWKQYL